MYNDSLAKLKADEKDRKERLKRKKETGICLKANVDVVKDSKM